MQKNDYINLSLDRLSYTINSFKNDTMNDFDKSIVSLLQSIIIIEKTSATPQSVYAQLKENYLGSDLVTANFICNLYGYDSKTLDTYLDIFLEQVFEGETNKESIDCRIATISDILGNISEKLVVSLNQKLERYQSEFKL